MTAQGQAMAKMQLVPAPMHKLAHLPLHSLTRVCSQLQVQGPLQVAPLDALVVSGLMLIPVPKPLPMMVRLLTWLVRLPQSGPR